MLFNMVAIFVSQLSLSTLSYSMPIFPKSEKLTSKTQITALFKQKRTAFSYPFKIASIPSTSESDSEMPKVLISVPKRAFKFAVDRNRIKRQIREIYRLGKDQWFGEGQPKPSCIGIIYVGQKKEGYQYMQKRMNKAMKKLQDQLATD